MTVISSDIDRDSETFKANSIKNKGLIAELRREQKEAR